MKKDMVTGNAPLSRRRTGAASRDAEPTNQDAISLVNLLCQLAPSAPEPRIWHAADFAARWIDQYRDQVRGPHPEVKQLHEDRSKARKELQALSRAIEKVAGRLGVPALVDVDGKKVRKGRPVVPGLIDTLSPVARDAIGVERHLIARRLTDESNSLLKRGDHRYVAIRAELADWQTIMRDFQRMADGAADGLAPLRPSKHWNPDNFLACGMCQTLGSALRVKVAMTRSTDRPDEKPKTANYWKLLKLAFELAGGQSPEDLMPIMRAGLTLAYPFGITPYGPAPGRRAASKESGKSTP